MAIELIEGETYQYRTRWESEAEQKKMNKKTSKRDLIRENTTDIVIKQYFGGCTYEEITNWLSEQMNTDFDASEVQRVIKEFPPSQVKSIIAESFFRQLTTINGEILIELYETISDAREGRKSLKKNDPKHAEKLKIYSDIGIKCQERISAIISSSKVETIDRVDEKAKEQILDEIKAIQARNSQTLEQRILQESENSD